MPGIIFTFYPPILGHNYNSSFLDDTSVSCDKRIQLCNHHHNQDLELFQQPQKSLMTFCCQFLSPVPDPGNHDLLSVPTSLPFPEYDTNGIMHYLFCLASFTLHNAMRVIYIASCTSNLFHFTAE